VLLGYAPIPPRRHFGDLTCRLVQGSTYSFPFRPISGQSTLKEIRDSLRGFQDDIKNASSILIVGGGPTGAEFAGEIAAQHKDKKITVGLHDTLLRSQRVPALSSL
jgi:pyruvate/2-oxoglutarate dehydrogenase complex dihydrolipoamide dehydrogenase (E3) component